MTISMTEADLQASIIGAARDAGWMVYHTRNPWGSETGFPDLVMVRPPRVIFAELKAAKGGLRRGRYNQSNTRWLPGQDEWKQSLERCPGVEYYLWRPSDLEDVYTLLYSPD